MKRFLCGVEGVRLAGGSIEAVVTGGVLHLVGSCMVVEWLEPDPAASGDNDGGVGWGMVVSKSSERNKFEYVRFASSAVFPLATTLLRTTLKAYFSENEVLH